MGTVAVDSRGFPVVNTLRRREAVVVNAVYNLALPDELFLPQPEFQTALDHQVTDSAFSPSL